MKYKESTEKFYLFYTEVQDCQTERLQKGKLAEEFQVNLCARNNACFQYSLLHLKEAAGCKKLNPNVTCRNNLIFLSAKVVSKFDALAVEKKKISCFKVFNSIQAEVHVSIQATEKR